MLLLRWLLMFELGLMILSILKSKSFQSLVSLSLAFTTVIFKIDDRHDLLEQIFMRKTMIIEKDKEGK